MCPQGYAFLRKLARMAKNIPGYRDGTKYTTSRIGAHSFLTHHMQRFAVATTNAHAKHINDRVDALKVLASRSA